MFVCIARARHRPRGGERHAGRVRRRAIPAAAARLPQGVPGRAAGGAHRQRVLPCARHPRPGLLVRRAAGAAAPPPGCRRRGALCRGVPVMLSYGQSGRRGTEGAMPQGGREVASGQPASGTRLGVGVDQSSVPSCGAGLRQPCIRPGASTGGAALAGGAAHLHARAAGARLGRAGAGRAGRAGAHLAAHAPRRGGDLCAAQRLLPAPCRQARRGGCQPRNAGRWARRTGGACMSMRHGDAARRRLAQLLRTTAGARIAWPAQGGRARACRLCAAGGAAARGAGAGARDGRAGHPAESHRHAPPAGALAAGLPCLGHC